MPIIGFNFVKILVERKSASRGKVDIKNNVKITDVGSADLTIHSKKDKVLRFKFEFTSVYKPSIGSVLFTGDLIYMNETSKQDAILDSWKADKKVPKEFMGEILNNILARCNIQALVLSRDVNLPSPIPLPKVKT